MSPRRKFEPGEESLLVPQATKPQRWMRWRPRLRKPPRPRGLPLLTTLAAALMAGAVAVCALILVDQEARERAAQKDQDVLIYVRSFMTEFTSIDPFHANDYVDRVLAQATGDFEKKYHDQVNQILLNIARAERSTGIVLDAGVERWNDDGSANVLVATAVTSKSPDGKQVFENTDRWIATAKQEGNTWKISNLLQVI
jgi:Mce-associated membrane protein